MSHPNTPQIEISHLFSMKDRGGEGHKFILDSRQVIKNESYYQADLYEVQIAGQFLHVSIQNLRLFVREGFMHWALLQGLVRGGTGDDDLWAHHPVKIPACGVGADYAKYLTISDRKDGEYEAENEQTGEYEIRKMWTFSATRGVSFDRIDDEGKTRHLKSITYLPSEALYLETEDLEKLWRGIHEWCNAVEGRSDMSIIGSAY